MENEKSQKREKSSSYPNFPLSDVIDFSSQLRKALGKGPYSRLEVAKGMGHSGDSGPAMSKLSTMVQFGLIIREGNNAYVQTELAERINHPISDEDKNQAIRQSVSMPRLYKDLLVEFSGQGIPNQLGNILIRKGISAKVSEKVVVNFKKSLEFAGLLKNGVVLSVPNLPNKEKDNRDDLNKESSLFFSEWPSSDSGNRGTKQIYNFNESGMGWSLVIKSGKPLTANIKKQLVDVTEFLEKENNTNN